MSGAWLRKKVRHPWLGGPCRLDYYFPLPIRPKIDECNIAWLGLVPKQMSTGDRTILGRISKRGNRYLLLGHGDVLLVLLSPRGL